MPAGAQRGCAHHKAWGWRAMRSTRGITRKAALFLWLALLSALAVALFAASAIGIGKTEWQATPSTDELKDISSPTGMIAYAAGKQGVYKTSDGGASWAISSLATELAGISFADSLNGWATGQRGLILHTSDGGSTWTTQTSPAGVSLGRVDTLDASRAWIAVSGYARPRVLRTTNGGASWEDTSTSDLFMKPLNAVSFADALNGWAVGVGGVVMHSTDGGEHWIEQLSGTPYELKDVDAVTPLEAWAVGGNTAGSGDPVILHTADGGANWQSQTTTFTNTLQSVKFTSATDGWICGIGAVQRTTDGGVTWTTVFGDGTQVFFGIDALPAGPRYITSSDGKVLKLYGTTGDLSGRVTSRISGLPIAGVSIQITGGPATTTGSDGTYTFTGLPAGTYSLTFRSPGYVDGANSATVQLSDTAMLDAALTLAKTTARVSKAPSRSSLIYKRKKGIAKYTLASVVSDANGPCGATTIYLQSSANGKSKWKNVAKLTADSTGKASHSFRSKKRSTVYYRWSLPDSPAHFSAITTKQKVIVK